jgi:hypothetical protein
MQPGCPSDSPRSGHRLQPRLSLRGLGKVSFKRTPAPKARQIRFGVIDRLHAATKQPCRVTQPSNLPRLQRSRSWISVPRPCKLSLGCNLSTASRQSPTDSWASSLSHGLALPPSACLSVPFPHTCRTTRTDRDFFWGLPIAGFCSPNFRLR